MGFTVSDINDITIMVACLHCLWQGKDTRGHSALAQFPSENMEGAGAHEHIEILYPFMHSLFSDAPFDD